MSELREVLKNEGYRVEDLLEYIRRAICDCDNGLFDLRDDYRLNERRSFLIKKEQDLIGNIYDSFQNQLLKDNDDSLCKKG